MKGIEALRQAKCVLGSEAAVAAVVGVKQPSVNHILNNGKKVPAEWCIAIERATAAKGPDANGVDQTIYRWQLRPDLYPGEDPSPTSKLTERAAP